jgi:hypothetical protein
MEFLIVTNTFTYTIKKDTNSDAVFLNDKEINLDMKAIKPEEKDDVMDVYKTLVVEGRDPSYAAAKATLFYADYIELGESATIEFLDTLVLYLAGFIKIPVKINEKYKKITITINDNSIKSKSEIEFNPHQSVIIPYNYKKLLVNLLEDYQA